MKPDGRFVIRGGCFLLGEMRTQAMHAVLVNDGSTPQVALSGNPMESRMLRLLELGVSPRA